MDTGTMLYFSKKIIVVDSLDGTPHIFFKPSAFFLCGNLAIHHDSALLAPLAWFYVRNEQFDAIHCQFGYLSNIGLI